VHLRVVSAMVVNTVVYRYPCPSNSNCHRVTPYRWSDIGVEQDADYILSSSNVLVVGTVQVSIPVTCYGGSL
jgi:hypothetical protein